MTAILAVWPQRVLFAGEYRGAITLNYIKDSLVIALDHPVSIAGVTPVASGGAGVILAPPLFNCEMQVEGRVVILSLDIMRYSRMSLLQNYVFEDSASGVKVSTDAHFQRFFLPWWEQTPAQETLEQQLDQLINPQGALLEKRELDVRIRQVLQIAYQRRGEKILAIELAKAVGLSESRLRHLFKQEMQVALGDMLTSWRLMGFLSDFCRYRSITHAAAEAGYADASHLNRAIQGLLGMPFSKLMACNPDMAFYSAIPAAR